MLISTDYSFSWLKKFHAFGSYVGHLFFLRKMFVTSMLHAQYACNIIHFISHPGHPIYLLCFVILRVCTLRSP